MSPNSSLNSPSSIPAPGADTREPAWALPLPKKSSNSKVAEYGSTANSAWGLPSLWYCLWQPGGNQAMPHILVIDDNAANLKLVCDILECEGYSVDRATDAEAALVKVTASRFDLVLTDVGLPGMDGLALTRILKANELTRRVPVIAVTAFAMKGDDQRAIKAGCDGYITKPIDTRRLVKQIEGYLSGGARRAGHNGDFR